MKKKVIVPSIGPNYVRSYGDDEVVPAWDEMMDHLYEGVIETEEEVNDDKDTN